jgi:hypothetical protein
MALMQRLRRLLLRIPADGNGRRTDARLDILDDLHGRAIED